MHIRKYQPGDAPVLRDIFFATVRNINKRDYSEAQVRAWAPDDYDSAAWCERLEANQPFVACVKEQVVGFADVQSDGYIDHFFCHAKYQGQGVGKALMAAIMQAACEQGIPRLYSHVSITAKPFFLCHGFQVVKEQQVTIRGEQLTNFLMEKQLLDTAETAVTNN